MPKTLLKPRIFSNKFKQNPKPQIKNSTSTLPPNLQTYKQKLLSGNSFLIYK